MAQKQKIKEKLKTKARWGLP